MHCASQKLSLFTLRRSLWCHILDPVTQTIGNNLKGDWEKGQIQDMLHNSVVRKFSREVLFQRSPEKIIRGTLKIYPFFISALAGENCKCNCYT